MKEKIDQVAKDLREAIAGVGEKHNLEIKVGGISYTATDLSCRVTAVDLDASDGKSKDAMEYEKRATFYGLPADGLGKEFTHLGKTFTHLGKTFTITGLNPRRPKYPVSAKGEDGKSYKFPVIAVKQGLKTG